MLGESDLIKRYAVDEDGNVTIFSVFMLVLIIMITGAAVDIMRFEASRAKLQSTMDRAVLAAADLDQQQDPEDVIDDYLAKSGMGNLLVNKTVEEAENYRLVAVDGDATLDTFFLHMSSFDTLTAPAASVAEEKIANVEISLVLDISGSMRFSDRITRMKPAAQHFVEKVMTDGTAGITTMNLVPFAGHVNPGDSLFDYFRGERPKIKNENNGWGNGDQDAPGNSLCNNNAENAEEGAADPACDEDGNVFNGEQSADGFFTSLDSSITNIVFYFDTDGDDVYDVAHKVKNFPSSASRDADDFFEGMVAYLMADDSDLVDPEQFLGASTKAGSGSSSKKYFQVKGDNNGPATDIGPTKNNGKIPGNKYDYSDINFGYWEASYVSPNAHDSENASDTGSENSQGDININMPGSCVEIYSDEFATTAMPLSDDYVPHFMYWPIAEDVMDWGWCPGEDTAIQYYSADSEALQEFIGDMRMHDGTGTQFGMKYALALLDPTSREAVSYLIEDGEIDSRFEGRPIDWHDEETEKYIVLMTDGQTTDQYRPVDPKDAINGEVELQVQGGSSYTNMSNKSTNITHLKQQCDLAKSLGVTVFTIAFETNSAASSDMLYCASSASHYFHVTGDEIYDAFDIVARQINNLRLIQ